MALPQARLSRRCVGTAIGFPHDFMFVLNQIEFEDWRSQIVISNADRKGLRYAPMAFTEQGVAMLSSV
jgi:hypothetical protein